MFAAHVSSLSAASRATSSHPKKLATCMLDDGLCCKRVGNMFSVTTILSTTLPIVKQHTFCTLLVLSYLFSFCIGLGDGEPQMVYFNNSRNLKLKTMPKSQFSETTHKPSRRETDQGENGGGNEDEDDIQYIIHRTTIVPDQLVEKSVLHDRNHSNFVQENTAAIMASSFRNFDNQASNSKESGGISPSVGPTVKKKPRICQRDALKKCIDGLPPMNDTGLPTSPEAVNRACRFYDFGISCFDSWAKNCLPPDQRQKVRTSITGAHEMYSFLCKDPKFRSDYLKHKECYKALSPYWDECSRQFIDGLRRNIRNNKTAFCCIRLEFVTCVSKYSSHLCSYEATRFSMKMAETLIRTSTRAPIPDCLHVHPKNCIPIIDSGSAHFFMAPVSVILVLVLVTFSSKLMKT